MDLNVKEYDLEHLRYDLKNSLGGIDGATEDLFSLSDEDLLNEYVYIYGQDSLDYYKIVP